MLDFTKLRNIVKKQDKDLQYFISVYYANMEVLEYDKGLSEAKARNQFAKDLAQETGLSTKEILHFLDDLRSKK